MGRKYHLLTYVIIGLWLGSFAALGDNPVMFHPDASMFDQLVAERQGFPTQIRQVKNVKMLPEVAPQVSTQSSSQVFSDPDVPIGQPQPEPAPVEVAPQVSTQSSSQVFSDSDVPMAQPQSEPAPAPVAPKSRENS